MFWNKSAMYDHSIVNKLVQATEKNVGSAIWYQTNII